MIQIADFDHCCGCGACASICPNHCISMHENQEGFLYPTIKQSCCVQCGLCEKACPVLHADELALHEVREAYGAASKNKALLLQSSSGGLFTLLAERVLERGGAVFGAAFSSDFKSVQHIMVEQIRDLALIRGSKYLQSDLNNCYATAKRELQRGRIVLFSGTPCQIAGLRSYLRKPYDSLLCVDIVCHGVPSPLLWGEYLRHMESMYNAKTTMVSFRSKEISWREYQMRLIMGDSQYTKFHLQDPFFRLFLNDTCLRESCYHCQVKEAGSAADLTIGDFWGVENNAPSLDRVLGVSLALPHTVKGHAAIMEVLPSTDWSSVDYDSAASSNPSYCQSVNRPKQRASFYPDLISLGWCKASKKYTRITLSARIRKVLSASPVGALRRALLNRNA